MIISSLYQDRSPLAVCLSSLLAVSRKRYEHLFFVRRNGAGKLFSAGAFYHLDRHILDFDRPDDMILKNIYNNFQLADVRKCGFLLRITTGNLGFYLVTNNTVPSLKISPESFWISGFRDQDEIDSFISEFKSVNQSRRNAA